MDSYSVARREGADWVSAALELVALASGVVSWLLLTASRDRAFWLVAFLVIGLGSGIGWIRAGRVGTGCVMALVRAVAVAAFTVGLLYSLRGSFCERAQCPSTNELITWLLLIGFFIAYFAIPIASAL